MRLIDADAIPYVIVRGLTSTMNADTRGGEIAFRCNVERQPTIEAIPIEWIEKWFENALRSANDGNDVTVDVMLDAWRKENGRVD